MLECEIRILTADGSPSIITQEVHLNAASAINKARRLAGQKAFEVWSNDRCLYSTLSAPTSSAPPTQPAA